MKFQQKQAIYLQIGEHICENILMKRWKAGDRIPSIREMAINIEVNPNTVMRTYNYLQDREIIYNKRGIGYFVGEKGYIKTQELMKSTFVNHELPHFFWTMDLLEITFDDLKKLYESVKENKGI
jgi:DNA-binding transcriptional regulator YhcF (GntR family)